MKKRDRHSKVENLTLLFAGLFIVFGFVLGNTIETTGHAIAGQVVTSTDCKLMTFQLSNEEICYGIDHSGKKNCVWKDNTCKFTPVKQTCFQGNRGYCSKPNEICTRIDNTNICI